MDADPEILVVLSDDLLSHLRRVAQEQHVSLRWLVAGLVCDTLETGLERSGDRQVAVRGS
jgi:hypothetical protein